MAILEEVVEDGSASGLVSTKKSPQPESPRLTTFKLEAQRHVLGLKEKFSKISHGIKVAKKRLGYFIGTSTPYSEFHLFMKLPTELRIKIWLVCFSLNF